MAGQTQGDQVGQFIGLQIALVFATLITKGNEWANMVNIKQPFALPVLATAMTARVLVSLSTSLPLLFPVRAVIVTTVSSFPPRRILAAIVLPPTFSATESSSTFARRPYLKLPSAMNAQAIVVSGVRLARTGERAVFRSCFATAFHLEASAANLANFLDWVVIVGCLALERFSVTTVRAIQASRTTVCNKFFAALLASSLIFLLRKLQLAGATTKLLFRNVVRNEVLAAIFALKDLLGRHKKSPVGSDPQLVEGARLPTGDIEHTSRISPAGQTHRAFDSFIIPQEAKIG